MLFAQAFDPLRSVQATGRLFRHTPVTLFLGGLLPIALQFAIQLPMQIVVPLPFIFGGPLSQEQLGRMFPIVFGLGFLMAMASIALSCWIDIGFCRAVELALRTGQEQTRTIFRGADRFWTLVLARVLIGLALLSLMLPVFVMMMVLLVFASLQIPAALRILAVLALELTSMVAMVYVILGFSMVTAIVAMEDCSATAAIGRSWRYARGNRWRLIWFHLFIFFLSVAGTLACFVGLAVALPLAEAMRYEAYIALTKGTQYPQWWIGGAQPAETFASPG